MKRNTTGKADIFMVDLQKLLAQMTLEEKIGQLGQYNAAIFTSSSAGITGPAIEAGLSPDGLSRVGSVLNFFSAQEMRQIQQHHLETDRNKIPMLFMMDVIHGYRTIFPIPLGLGCSFDTELVSECTRMASREAAAGGVQVTFTPMVDYVRDARWGRVMETCGEEPMLNGRMGAAQVKAFHGESLADPDSIATCVKHYAGYGGAEAGRDYNTVELSEHLLREYYLPAYKACIDAGVDMVMPSFNSLNGVPSTANRHLMQDILRGEWGFDGVVISDYNAIGELLVHGVAADPKEAAKLAFACSCDIEMCSTAYYNHLKQLVEEGVFTEAQVDEAVMRVLKLKEQLGLFEDPYRGASNEKSAAVCLTEENRALARRMAESSAVLLKNEGVLPFSKSAKRIALIGPMADEHKIIGFWSCNGVNEESVTVAEGIRKLLPEAEVTVVRGCGNLWDDSDRSGFDEAIAAAKAADVVVLCLGEPQDYSGEGNSRIDIKLPGVQEELAIAVAQANPNTAVLTFSGRPLVLTALDAAVPAILHMWFPGTEGGSAAANLLFGEANPCGKLSMSFPKHVGQCPIYYNHPLTGRPKNNPEHIHAGYTSNYIGCGNLPLYSFGYGLSYANFVYEGLTLDRSSMTKDSTVTATVTVRNDSNVAGSEVVQLYIRDLVATTVRPVQQLIDFRKVTFAPGETKQITFTVTEEQLRIWDRDDRHVSEPGDFEISTGYADHLLHTKKFTLQ